MQVYLRTSPDTEGKSRICINDLCCHCPSCAQKIVQTAERSSVMLEQYDDLLTTDEACEVLKMGKNALYELLASGSLKVF